MYKYLLLLVLPLILFVGCGSDNKVRVVSTLEKGKVVVDEEELGEIRVGYATVYLSSGDQEISVQKLSADGEWLYISTLTVDVDSDKTTVVDLPKAIKKPTEKRLSRLKKEEADKLAFVKKVGINKVPEKNVFIDVRNNLIWADEPATIQKRKYFEAEKFCFNSKLAGITGWRVPTLEEAQTIVNKSRKNNMISQLKHYRGSSGGTMWTSTPPKRRGKYADVYTITFWASGDKSSASYNQSGNYVRCVKSGNTEYENRIYQVKKDKEAEIKRQQQERAKDRERIAKSFDLDAYPQNVFLDTETGLMWENTQSQLNTWGYYSNAKKHCQKLSLGGYTNWRLPTTNELVKLYRQPKPKYLSFSKKGWSSYYTSEVTKKYRVPYVVSEKDGKVKTKESMLSYHYRCVRVMNESNLTKAKIALKNKNYKKAFELYLPYAKKGNAEAMEEIAALYEFGNGIEKNDKEAFKWYEKSVNANASNYYPYFRLAMMLSQTQYKFVDKDLYKARKLLEKSLTFTDGYSKAKKQVEKRLKLLNDLIKSTEALAKARKKRQDLMAKLTLEEALKLSNKAMKEKKYKEAFDLMLPQANKGESIAMEKIANAYYFGDGVEKNRTEATKWYQKAVATKKSSYYPYYRLAIANAQGAYGVSKNISNAKTLAQDALNKTIANKQQKAEGQVRRLLNDIEKGVFNAK